MVSIGGQSEAICILSQSIGEPDLGVLRQHEHRNNTLSTSKRPSLSAASVTPPI